MISYQIYILLKKRLEIQIGKLGNFNFPSGVYVYSGSAKKNINKRLQRHFSKNKICFWHIDYLLADQNVKIIKIIKSNILECDLNKKNNGKVIARGFGSSDCKKGCKSHLIYIAKNNKY